MIVSQPGNAADKRPTPPDLLLLPKHKGRMSSVENWKNPSYCFQRGSGIWLTQP
jgi:hypothetical protein